MHSALFTFGNTEVHVSGFPVRQAETIARTAIGHSSKQTAKEMGISPRTVEMNLNLAMAKLGASNRPHLIARAFSTGQLAIRNCCVALCLGLTLVTATIPTSSNNPDDFNRLATRSVRIRRRNEELTLTALTEDNDA